MKGRKNLHEKDTLATKEILQRKPKKIGYLFGILWKKGYPIAAATFSAA